MTAKITTTYRNYAAANPETINDLVYAAELRLHDSELLLASGHLDASVYLAGYVVEMMMKVGTFRQIPGHSLAGAIAKHLAYAAKWLQRNYPLEDFESKHSVHAWFLILEGHRPRPFPAAFRRDLFPDRQRASELDAFGTISRTTPVCFATLYATGRRCTLDIHTSNRSMELTPCP